MAAEAVTGRRLWREPCGRDRPGACRPGGRVADDLVAGEGRWMMSPRKSSTPPGSSSACKSSSGVGWRPSVQVYVPVVTLVAPLEVVNGERATMALTMIGRSFGGRWGHESVSRWRNRAGSPGPIWTRRVTGRRPLPGRSSIGPRARLVHAQAPAADWSPPTRHDDGPMNCHLPEPPRREARDPTRRAAAHIYDRDEARCRRATLPDLACQPRVRHKP